MVVQLIYPLGPGATVGITEDSSVVKVTYHGEEMYFDPFGNPEFSIGVENITFTDDDFHEILSIPSDSPDRFIFGRMDIDSEDGVTSDNISLLERGAIYTVSMGRIDENDPQSKEIEVTLFHVLRRTKDTASLLGIIGLEEEGKVKEDENIVAVLDLLGYSAIMRTHSLDDLEFKITNGLLSTLVFTGLYSTGALLFDEEGNIEYHKEASRLEYGVISDTVVLYAKDTRHIPLEIICEAVACLLDTALQMEWLFRGAIDIDTFRAVPDHNIYLGKALINAHKLELVQEWSGCILSSSIEERFPEEISEMASKGLIVEYDVPVKSPSAANEREKKTYWAINWCYFKSGNDKRRLILEEKLGEAKGKAKAKVMETIQFLDEMERRGLASIENIVMPVFGDSLGHQGEDDPDDLNFS